MTSNPSYTTCQIGRRRHETYLDRKKKLSMNETILIEWSLLAQGILIYTIYRALGYLLEKSCNLFDGSYYFNIFEMCILSRRSGSMTYCPLYYDILIG